MTRPTIGRIVHYNRHDDVCAALITRVLDARLGVVDLTVFPPRSMPFTERSVSGDRPGEWAWPKKEGQ